MSTSLGIMRTLTCVDSKFLQPGFAYSFNIMKNKKFYDPSILQLKYVNGYERNYNITHSPFSQLKHEIEYINDLVEFERAMGGQDDELEDEV
jgi:hypothetical protein